MAYFDDAMTSRELFDRMEAAPGRWPTYGADPDIVSSDAFSRYFSPRTERELRAFQSAQADFARSQRVEPAKESMDDIYMTQAANEDVARYLNVGFDKDLVELHRSVLTGDALQAEVVRDRIRKFTDENREALVQWMGVGDGDAKSVATRFAGNARSMLGEEYMGDDVSVGGGAALSAAELIDGESEGARSRARTMAVKNWGVSEGAADILVNKDNPFYATIQPFMSRYKSARKLQASAADPVKFAGVVAQTDASAKMAAEFLASHADAAGDPAGRNRISDFVTAWGSREGAVDIGPSGLSAMWGLYSDYADKDQTGAATATGWWAGFDECVKSSMPQVEKQVPDGKGGYKTVLMPSDSTDHRRLAGTALMAAKELRDTGRDVDFAALKTPLATAVRKADQVAASLGLSDLSAIGRGDAAARSAVYSITRDDSLNDVGGGRARGDFLDEAVSAIQRAGATFGIEVDPETRRVKSLRDPAGVGLVTTELVQSVLRERLSAEPARERTRAKQTLSRMIRQKRTGADAGDPDKAAEALLDMAQTNYDKGISGMSLTDMINEMHGGIRVEENPETGEVTARRVISERAGSRRVDPATGATRGETPLGGPGFFSMDPSWMTDDKKMDWAKRRVALDALRDMPKKDLPYAYWIDSYTRDALVGALEKIHDIKQHQYTQGANWNPREMRAMVPNIGRLLAKNLDRNGVDMPHSLWMFVESGDMIRYLECQDKWFDTVGSGDGKLNKRAWDVRRDLADRIVRGEASPAEVAMWTRLFVVGLNRGTTGELVVNTRRHGGYMVNQDERVIISQLPAKTRQMMLTEGDTISGTPEIFDAEPIRSLTDKEAPQVQRLILEHFGNVYGWDVREVRDPLVQAGYKPVPIGVPTTGDYGGIVYQFDTAMRYAHPEGDLGRGDKTEGEPTTPTPTPTTVNNVVPDMGAQVALAGFLRANVHGTDAQNFLVKEFAQALAPEMGSKEAAMQFANDHASMFGEMVHRHGFPAAYRRMREMTKLRSVYDEYKDPKGGTYYGMRLVGEDEYERHRAKWIDSMADSGAPVKGDPYLQYELRRKDMKDLVNKQAMLRLQNQYKIAYTEAAEELKQ